MLSRFFKVWCSYWLVVLLLPVSSIYENTLGAFLLQLGFVLLVGGSSVIVLAAVGYQKMPMAVNVNVYRAETIAWISLLISFVALILLLYDKVYLQGVDYSQGIAVAREQWRRLGEERNSGISSLFSAAGYMFGSFYYVAALLAVTQLNTVKNSSRTPILLLCFVLVMINSVVAGGRSNILLLAAFLYGAVGAYRGVSIRRLILEVSHRRLIKLIVGLGLAYMIAVFYLRANVGGGSGIGYYVLSFLPYLGLEADPWFQQFVETSIFGGPLSSVVIAFSYITHSFATVAAIVDHGTEDKTVILIHVYDLLSKIGLIRGPDSSWFLSGKFPSVPGALLLQFGLAGFAICSIFLGIAAALAKSWAAASPSTLLAVGANSCMEAILILSPAVFAGDFMSFPFVVFAFFGCALIQFMFRLRCFRREIT